VRRKIIHAMARREGELLLRGSVELDEGFIGGKRSGPASRGRRRPGRTLVAISAEQMPGGDLGRAYLRVVADASACSLSAAAHVTIAAGYGHLPRDMPTGADVDQWLPFSHIVLADFKRWTLDIFHGVSPAHLRGLPRRVL